MVFIFNTPDICFKIIIKITIQKAKMETLTVAIFSDTYLPARDGVVTYIETLRSELERKGHNVIIATVAGKSDIGNNAKNVYTVRGHRFPLYDQYKISVMPFSIGKKLLSSGAGIVHTQTPFMLGIAGQRFARAAKIPSVSTFHSLVFQESAVRGYLPKNEHTVKFVEKRIKSYFSWHYRQYNAVISPSEFTAKVLLDHIGLSSVIINNAVAVSRFVTEISREDAKKKLGYENRKIVLFLGRISKEKNLEVMIKAARITGPEIDFVIVGTGPHLDFYKTMADEMGLKNVKFPGFVDDLEIHLYLKAADIFCNPSNFEVMSTVDVESLAAGTPILVPSETSQEELVHGGKCGRVFMNSDPDDLAKKIREMIRDEADYDTLPYADLYSPENHANRLLELYKKVMNEYSDNS
jgi:glycosyltransferase involved in cell wall biosynthesis